VWPGGTVRPPAGRAGGAVGSTGPGADHAPHTRSAPGTPRDPAQGFVLHRRRPMPCVAGRMPTVPGGHDNNLS